MIQLPLNCSVQYDSHFLSEEEANQLFHHLTNDYKIDQLMFDSPVYQIHKLSFVDQELKDKDALPEDIWGESTTWSNEMMILKNRVEQLTGKTFAVCVAILYPDGTHGVDYHSDYPAFGDTSVIASLSLGATRTFNFREKSTGKVHQMKLDNGTLIIMGEGSQDLYEHAVPVEPESKESRINLTFRMYGFE